MIKKATLNDSYVLAELAINIFENNTVEELKLEFDQDQRIL